MYESIPLKGSLGTQKLKFGSTKPRNYNSLATPYGHIRLNFVFWPAEEQVS